MFATALDAYLLGCLAVPLSFALLARVLRVRAQRADRARRAVKVRVGRRG